MRRLPSTRRSTIVGVAEHLEVLRDERLAQAEPADDVGDRPRAVAQVFDDREPIGFGQGGERVDHADQTTSRVI